MKMKQMPFKIEDGAVEMAKYRAKMAVREVANPAEQSPHRVQWRWFSAVVAVAVVAVGVFAFAKVLEGRLQNTTPMEQLLAEMNSASDDIIYDLSVDSGYYLEEENQL